MHSKIRLPFTFLVLITLAACATKASNSNWPSDLPDRRLFVDAYLENRQIDNVDEAVIEAHLVWIVRFYQGTVLYPNGWNRASMRFLASIDDQATRNQIAVRMKQLGIAIANEWSQDNAVRKINSTNVATWGSALRTAAESNDQLMFIGAVERDVALLIDGSLKSNEIAYERYYPEEDYDNF